MTLDGYLNILAQIIFLLLAAITLLGWARQRNQTRLDIALVFTSLAVYFIFQDLQNFYQGAPPLPIALLTSFGLLAQPYLLLRVARYFRPLSSRVQWAALLSFGFSCALLAVGEIFFANNTPVLFLILAIIVGYFIIVEAYASLLLVQGAFKLSGITGKRLRLASLGSGSLVALFIVFLVVIGLAVTQLITPDQAQVIWLKALLQVFFILSGLSYYLGFAPPRWLSRAWQLDELHRYLQETSAEPTHERAAAFDLLSMAALRSVGGSLVGVAAWDSADQQLKLALGGDPPWQTNDLAQDPGVIGQAWRSRKADVARLSKDWGLEALAWADQVKAQTLFVVPILGAAEAWGLLIVAVPHAPLFAEDDLDLLVLLTRQTAATLDYAVVIEDLHTLNQSLETRVAERTAELSRVNRALRTISDCNQVLVRSRSEADLLNEICRIIIEAGGYRMVWVGYPEQDDPKTVRPAAWAGVEDGFLDLIRPSWGDGEQGRAPLGTAIRTGQTQIVRVAVDPIYPAWQAAALQRGYAACLALPFFDHNRVFGGLSIFASQPEAFDAAEVNLLSELAADLAFGLTALRTQAAHDRAEIDLQISQQRLAGILGSAMDAIITVDASQHILFFNTAAEKMFRRAQSEVIGQSLDQLIPTRFRAAHARHIEDFGQTGITNRAMGTLGDLSAIRADGEEFPVEASISQITERGQKLYSVILRDITERKQAEADLRVTLAKLEVNNRELQDFAYVASHDLQEPLRKIQAFGDRLKRRASGVLDETTRDYLDRMQNAAGRMQALINDLLTFSRVTTKAQPFVAVDLALVVKEVLSDLEIRVERSGGQVEIGPLPTLEADPTQMRQVLQNLLGNALKFHKPDVPPRVRVYSNVDGAICELIVSDNGIGFEEKYLDRIFTPFQRLHGRGEYEGTGIGLSVVRKIVERHGGQVTARSRPDEGSTFIVTLPLKQTAET